MIEKLPGADLYGSFAYDVSVLTYFVGIHNGGGREKQSGTKKHHTSTKIARQLRHTATLLKCGNHTHDDSWNVRPLMLSAADVLDFDSNPWNQEGAK